MNTNRNNNRRRGRNNNRGQSGGGNGGGNRIDSRARGNAPQLLEKYRKLAHDASLNDDRVQTEYYLQFADHYFRVLADSKQKDDTRPRNQNDRSQSFDDYEDDEDEFDGGARATPRGRPEQARDTGRDAARETGRDGNRRNDAEQDDSQASEQVAMEQQRGSEGDAIDPAAEENPFTRDTGRRGRKPRAAVDGEGAAVASEAREPREPRGRRTTARRAEVTETQGEASFDAMVLPPSISRTDDADSDGSGVEGEAPARARKAPARPRRRAARSDDTGSDEGPGETLEAVG